MVIAVLSFRVPVLRTVLFTQYTFRIQQEVWIRTCDINGSLVCQPLIVNRFPCVNLAGNFILNYTSLDRCNQQYNFNCQMDQYNLIHNFMTYLECFQYCIMKLPGMKAKLLQQDLSTKIILQSTDGKMFYEKSEEIRELFSS